MTPSNTTKRINKTERARLSEIGIGLNAFNSWVGQDNVRRDSLEFLEKHIRTLQQEFAKKTARKSFYLVRGSKGVLGGSCRVIHAIIDGSEIDVLRHIDNGNIILSDTIVGLQLLDESAARELCMKNPDVRRMKTIGRITGAEITREGVLLQGVARKFKFLVTAGKSGLEFVGLNLGPIAKDEPADLTIEAGHLSTAERARILHTITEASAAQTADTPPDLSALPDLDIHDWPGSAIEGKKLLRLHLYRERSKQLRDQKKSSVDTLACEVCGFVFGERYGLPEAFNYCEVHHLIPLASLKAEQAIRLEDLAILCANCHRVAHLGPPFTIDELRSSFRKL